MSPASVRKILRLPAVQAKTGLGRDSIYRLGRQGLFPARIKLRQRCSGWFEDEIESWLAERAAKRGAPERAA